LIYRAFILFFFTVDGTVDGFSDSLSSKTFKIIVDNFQTEFCLNRKNIGQ
jgi:hypothetical protein